MPTDQLSRVFAALGDPTRRAILSRLADGDANVAELAKPFAMSMPAVSRHLKVLEDAGLISRNRKATARPSHLEVRALKDATMWMENYRKFWDESFDRFDEVLDTLKRAQEPELQEFKQAELKRSES